MSALERPEHDGLEPSDHALTGLSVVDVLKAYVWPDSAAALHSAVARKLTWLGFDLSFEFEVMPWETRTGRIDLVATRHGGSVAIELDGRRPRRKSIDKLRTFPGFRIIALRQPSASERIQDIDRIVGLRVRPAYPDEAADKRTRRRPFQPLRMARTRR